MANNGRSRYSNDSWRVLGEVYLTQIIAEFCIKSPKYHVVLLADVVVLLFLKFVTADIFVYTIV